jgi:hypothetical protein
MQSLKPKTFTRTTRKTSLVVSCSGNKNSFNFNDIIERRREMDKQRIERLKEISTTLQHIAKSEADNTNEMLDQFLPFFKQLREKEWNKEEIENWFADVEKKIKGKCEDKKTVVEVDDDDDEEEFDVDDIKEPESKEPESVAISTSNKKKV